MRNILDVFGREKREGGEEEGKKGGVEYLSTRNKDRAQASFRTRSSQCRFGMSPPLYYSLARACCLFLRGVSVYNVNSCPHACTQRSFSTLPVSPLYPNSLTLSRHHAPHGPGLRGARNPALNLDQLGGITSICLLLLPATASAGAAGAPASATPPTQQHPVTAAYSAFLPRLN